VQITNNAASLSNLSLSYVTQVTSRFKNFLYTSLVEDFLSPQFKRFLSPKKTETKTTAENDVDGAQTTRG
jgi:hypothetical protein